MLFFVCFFFRYSLDRRARLGQEAAQSSAATDNKNENGDDGSKKQMFPTGYDASFADGAMYIRSRLELLESFGGNWHVVAAKANKGEATTGRPCSACIDADGHKVCIFFFFFSFCLVFFFRSSLVCSFCSFCSF